MGMWELFSLKANGKRVIAERQECVRVAFQDRLEYRVGIMWPKGSFETFKHLKIMFQERETCCEAKVTLLADLASVTLHTQVPTDDSMSKHSLSCSMNQEM